jgi:hypothetical protein
VLFEASKMNAGTNYLFSKNSFPFHCPIAKHETKHLSLSRVGVGETAHVVLDLAVATEELDVGTILLELALLAELDVVLAANGGETPVLGDDDLLATRELVHGAAEGLDGGGAVGVTGADGQDDLADVDTGDLTLGLSEGTTHTGLETIGSGARQHLVDTDDVEGVDADTEVETFLTGDLHEVPILSMSTSFPPFLARLLHLGSGSMTYLLAQIRAASRASEESCSYSLETR